MNKEIKKKIISFNTAKELGIIDEATERFLLTPIPRGLKKLAEKREEKIKLWQVDFKMLTLIPPTSPRY